MAEKREPGNTQHCVQEFGVYLRCQLTSMTQQLESCPSNIEKNVSILDGLNKTNIN